MSPASRQPKLVEQAVRLHAEIAKLAGAELSGPDEHAAQSFFPARRLAPARPRLQAKPALDLVGSKTLEAVVGYLEAVLPGLRRAAKARWN